MRPVETSGQDGRSQKTTPVRPVATSGQDGRKEIDKCIFRFKPKFQQPHAEPGRPWVWYVVLSMAAPQGIRDAFYHLAHYDCKYKDFVFAPSKTEDGLLVKTFWFG